MAERLYQRIASRLKEEFQQAGYVAGARLPTERDYAEHFNVSRTVVREAFIMLEIEGFIEVRKGSGLYLLEMPTQNTAALQAEEVGPFELLDARQTVESAIAGQAAQRINKMELAHLSRLLQQQAELLQLEEASQTEFETINAIDQDIHVGIANASQNTLLVEVVQYLWRQSKSSMWVKLHQRIPDCTYRQEWYAHHEQIIGFLRKRDAEGARNAMWRHIQRVKEVLFELSDTNAPDFDGFLFGGHQLAASLNND